TLAGVMILIIIAVVKKRERKPAHTVAYEMQVLIEGVKQNKNAIIITDATNKVIYWNVGAEQILGRTAKDMIGADLKAVELILPDTIKLDTPIDTEAKHGLGSMLPISLTVSESKVGTAVNYTAIIKSIMQRKEKEAELKSEISLLAMGERLSVIGSWRWNVSTGRVQCSDGFNAIWGTDDFTSDFDYLMSHVWYEDEPRVRAVLYEAMKNEDDYVITYRINQNNGKPQWILARGQMNRNFAGKVDFIEGTIQCINSEDGGLV
ncbi:MAG: PAS domain-containing protein, partial [Bacteroidota bacterium]